MASISISYPDDQQDRIVDALCYDGGWSADLGVTRGAFAKRMVAQLVKDRVRTVEEERARVAALAGVTPPAPVDVT
jgi:hypothetical protein